MQLFVRRFYKKLQPLLCYNSFILIKIVILEAFQQRAIFPKILTKASKHPFHKAKLALTLAFPVIVSVALLYVKQK